MAGKGGEKGSLEYTPTWVVAAVCSVIVLFSFTLERTIFYLGKVLKRKNRKPLLEALEKVKEELMLLGFISLLLSVFQGPIGHLCMPINFSHHMFPCKKEKEQIAGTSHYQIASFSGILGGKRRLLSGGSGKDHCTGKGKVQLLSQEALHGLHIFIFVLAIVHVLFTLFTIILGGVKIHEWERWEDSTGKAKHNAEQARRRKFTRVLEHSFIREHFKGIGKHSAILSWLHSFIKQFYGSLTNSDYITLRHGFIQMHCKGNPKFNFYKYMIRALEEDFKRVVGISWYLWIFVVIFLFLNVHGWNAYFWMSFIPLILVVAVGTKMEHVISQLAHEVAEKHIAIEGDLVVRPSDHHFWFHRPRLVLHLIHFILFHNAFEIAVFFWILIMFGFHSCIMGKVGYIIPRLVIGVTVQLLCSYSTLPLYAIVTQMGSSFKPAIFNEHVQEGLVEWAQNAKKKGPASNTKGSSSAGSLAGIQMQNVRHKELANEEAIVYTLIVQKFMDAEVSMIPAISRSSDPTGRVDTWPDQEEKLVQLHSPEAYEMIKNHLALILGNRIEDSNSVAQISKLRVGQVYAASVMYGYFLKRVDQRFQLEKTMKTLPFGSDEEETAIEQSLPDDSRPNNGMARVENSHPEWAGGVSSGGFGYGIKSTRLRSYVMSFDGETLQRYATIRSKEAVSIIEKHTEALFGRPEVVITPRGTIDSSTDEAIKISFAGLQRLVLEAVTFGSFLWDVESYVDSRYHFVMY